MAKKNGNYFITDNVLNFTNTYRTSIAITKYNHKFTYLWCIISLNKRETVSMATQRHDNYCFRAKGGQLV